MSRSRIAVLAVLMVAAHTLPAQTITPFVPTALPGATQTPAPAPAATRHGDEGSDAIDRHTLNLKGADINVLIQTVSEITGRSFIVRSEEHTSELQSLMRISYAVFCLKKNINQK